ncbi:MAG: FAD-dependent oxidoreductase, partial [Treponema sp.]|nr:FAD-dependent oxidoreductase [Treponema sp.]
MENCLSFMMILVFIKKIVYIFSGDFMKKLIVIGAGISGLSAGIYAARSGFDVTIMEQHFTFGGLSTGW